jgi:hypothetical protein
MTSVSIPTAGEAVPDLAKKYVTNPHLEIFPLDSSSRQPTYVVSSGEGKGYVISENLKDILQLFDGTRTLSEVAEALSADKGARVSDEHIRELVSTLVKRYNLIREAEPYPDTASRSQGESGVKSKSNKGSFEFVFRLPVISPPLARPITERLTWLFQPVIVITAVAAIILTHFAFMGRWFAPRPAISFGPSDILLCYFLAILTALVHEFGHATACRRYACEHGAIGFLLYIVFPSLYVDLSRTWRLTSKQRAVVDVGGVYFQLLTTIPLYLIYLLTGSAHCAVTILAVDVMVLLSLNPILKFDGYWLLVDLSGLINLRARSWRVIKEVVSWSLGRTTCVPVLNEVSGRGKKLLLVTYSFITLGMLTSFMLLLLFYAPSRVSGLVNAAYELALAPGRGLSAILLSIGKLLMSLFFLLFIYRFLRGTIFRLFSASAWRKTP